jgi:hypothetical protein
LSVRSQHHPHLEDKIVGAMVRVLENYFKVEIEFFLSNLGYVSHGEAIAHQRKSQVLLIEIDSQDKETLYRVNYLNIWFPIDQLLLLGLRILILRNNNNY